MAVFSWEEKRAEAWHPVYLCCGMFEYCLTRGCRLPAGTTRRWRRALACAAHLPRCSRYLSDVRAAACGRCRDSASLLRATHDLSSGIALFICRGGAADVRNEEESGTLGVSRRVFRYPSLAKIRFGITAFVFWRYLGLPCSTAWRGTGEQAEGCCGG